MLGVPVYEEHSVVTEVDVTPQLSVGKYEKIDTNKGMKAMWGTTKLVYTDGYALHYLLMGGKVGLGISTRTGNNVLEDGNFIT